jgi:hypothetical protein
MAKELNIKLNLYPQLRDDIELTQEQIDDLAYRILDTLSKVDLSSEIDEVKNCELSYQIHNAHVDVF